MKKLKGLLLDVYRTLVHEDDEIIPVICEKIRSHADREASVRDIGRVWWESFAPLVHRSYGDVFLSQRGAALMSLSETLDRFGAELDPEALIAPQFAHWVAPTIFPDTKPFLHYVEKQHIPVCIVSNIDRVDLEQAISFHNLEFEHIVTSDDVRSYKPRPEMFAAAMRKLGLAPEAVLHVGDSQTSDIAGAKAMGIPVAWLNRSGKQYPATPVPDHTVGDLGGLQVILETRLVP